MFILVPKTLAYVVYPGRFRPSWTLLCRSYGHACTKLSVKIHIWCGPEMFPFVHALITYSSLWKVSEMGYQAVKGLQGDHKSDMKSSTKVACSLKHFVGYSDPRSGQDRTQAWIPNRYFGGNCFTPRLLIKPLYRILRQYFLPSFRKAINAGASTVMETYGDVC